jgi:chromate reductase
MIAKNLQELAPPSLQMETVEIGDLAIFNQDFDDEGNTPAAWTSFRDRVSKFDAVLFVTPEYNRSVPAVLKNALDVGSRPYGKSVWDGMPGAVVSVSPGGLSAFGANHHLRQSLVFLNVPTMQQPEAYIGNVAALFDDNGVLINENTRGFLQNFMNSFASWVEKNAATRSSED